MRYRKKPVVIDAVQFTGENIEECVNFLDSHFENGHAVWATGFEINTLEGTMKGNVGDYIIKGIKGEFYPCMPDIFAATYEKVEDK